MRIGIDASRTFVENLTGTERYAFEVTTKLFQLPDAINHQWLLYVRPGYSKALSSKLKTLPNVQIIEIPMKFLWTQVGLAYRTWVDRLNVLWVPAHTLPLLRQPSWLRKGRRLRTVVTIHGLEYEWLPAYENPLQRWYLPLSTIYAAKTASKVIAVSEFTKSQLIDRAGIDSKKIKVIYEGFVPNIKSEISNLKSILNKYNLQSKKYLLFVGTIQPRKNLVRLIEAFARLSFDSAQDDKLKLVITGKWGWLYDEVKEAPKKFGVEDRVVFTNFINDTDRCLLLAKALVYVQPSITEGFGLPVLEAMEAGVPVVLSNGGALLEIGSGLFFDPYDVKDISLKLSLVISSQKLQRELIKKGKESIQTFSWNKAALETYNVLTKKD